MVAYAKPIGYDTRMFAQASLIFRPWNGFVSGDRRLSPIISTFRTLTLTFSAAPDDLSEIDVPDGGAQEPGQADTNFVFTWGGAPGAGIIPLVGGGGTAAQAATATSVAFNTQLVNWTVTNPSAGVVVMVSRWPGINPGITLTGVTNIGQTILAAVLGASLPGRFGKNFCFLPDTVPPTPG
jgi:hypothetical protein